MNIILRRCLAMLNLVLIRRDYFDPAAAQRLPVSNQIFIFVARARAAVITTFPPSFLIGTSNHHLARVFDYDSPPRRGILDGRRSYS